MRRIRPAGPIATRPPGAGNTRTGTAVAPAPPWPEPTYPKVAEGTVLVATLCYPATAAFGVDQVSGLPGPAARMLPARMEILAGP